MAHQSTRSHSIRAFACHSTRGATMDIQPLALAATRLASRLLEETRPSARGSGDALVDWRKVVTSGDGITDHVRAREEEHFRKKDRELIEKLRQADAAAKARQALEQEMASTIPMSCRN